MPSSSFGSKFFGKVLTHYVPGYFIIIDKMGPMVIYYHVNTIG